MKISKKILCSCLAVLMVLLSAPLSGFVDLDWPELGLSINASAAELAASGSCGDNVTYTFDSETGLLTISGTGKMKDYSYSGSPFYYNDDIKSVVIENGVTSVGKYAFSSCHSLESVTISDSVTSIGDYAFYSCDFLESVTISDGVTSIGEYAFSYCCSLVNITIGSGVTSIGKEAFYCCNSLESITVNEDNKYYSSDVNGILFNKDKTKLIRCPMGNKKTSYEIPDSVIVVSDSAFEGCDSLVSVTIGSGVTSIGERAFYGKSLESVTISASVKYIGNDAFLSISLNSIAVNNNNKYYSSDANGVLFNKDKTVLIQYPMYNKKTSYEIPDSVVTIGDAAFEYCTSLESVTIGSGVTSIGDEAFAYSAIKAITIPDNVISIGDEAFEDCDYLTSVTIGNGVTSIGDEAFYSCDLLASVAIGSGVTSIGSCAFMYCRSIEDITIPDSVTNIGEKTFEGTAYYDNEDNWVNDILYIGKHLIKAKKSIVSCIIKEGTICIANFAFDDCDSLESITIPNSVTIIGDEAFSDCGSLESITIPDGVISIGDAVFDYCYSLESVTIPASVKHIGACAFEGATSLKSITVNENNNYYSSDNSGVLFNKDKTELIQCPRGSAQTSYEVPSSVTKICDYAFFYCTSLENITIPDSVTSIGISAFDGTEYCNNEDNWEDGILYIGKHLVKARKSVASYTIKDETICIAGFAFYYCDIESITIPDSVVSIGDGAFAMSALKSVTIPNSVENIGLGTFMMCDALESVTIGDSVTSIDEGAFLYCTSLESITIGDSVTSIGYGAFAMSALKSVTIGNSVTSIGEMAFYLCDSLTDVYYNGSESDWNNIVIASNNGPLTSATIHYTEDDDHTHTNADPVKENEVDPTCQKAGSYDEVIYCTECGKEVSRKTINLPKLEHDYTSTQVDATCTEDGLITYVCSGCGDTCTETITAAGHIYGDWTTVIEATVVKPGQQVRICTACGEKETQAIDRLAIDWESNENYGLANFTIVDATTKLPLKNAWIDVVTVDGEQSVFYTDANGKVSIVLPVGLCQFTAGASGKQTRSLKYAITHDEIDVPNIGLSSESLIDADLTVKEMTYEDIIEAGIDVSPSDNYHAYKYTITLEYEADGTTSTKTIDFIKCNDEYKYINADTPNGGYYLNDKVIYPTEKFYLIVDGELTWLKQMFHVQMNIYNNSLTDTFEGVEATLILPDGLSLADMVSYRQTLTQKIDVVSEGSTEVCDWYIRGDKSGTYALKASLTGTLQPFSEEFSHIFETDSMINVYDYDALKLYAYVPTYVECGSVYDITIGIENISDTTLYNVTNLVKDVKQCVVRHYSDGTVIKEAYPTTNFDVSAFAQEFKPGDKLEITVSSEIFFNSEVFENCVFNLVGWLFEGEMVKTQIESGFGVLNEHVYGEWYTATPATVFSNGEERRDCTACDCFETREIDKLTEDKVVDDASGVQIEYDANAFDKAPTLDVSVTEGVINKYVRYKTFDISITIDGEKVQPNGTVTVKLPIPAGFEANATSAFYVDEDGNMTELDCYIKGGYLIFDTNHFSVYAIVDKSTEIHVHDHKVTKSVDATCTEDGYVTYTCSCGDTYDKTIEATGHALGDYTVVENANCTQAGSETANCSNCDYVDTRVIPATGHTFSGSTCTTCGYDRSDDCSCNCHSSGIAHFFFVIVNFFEKLFGNNKVCDCGAAH